jgi:hypothetical protein
MGGKEYSATCFVNLRCLFGIHWGVVGGGLMTGWFVVQTQFETVLACHQIPKPETKQFSLCQKFSNQNQDWWFWFGLNQVWVGLRLNFPNTNWCQLP